MVSVMKSTTTRAGRVAALLLPAFVLAACNTSGQVSETERNFTERLLFANNKLPDVKPPSREYTCPVTTILDGTVAYRVGDASARGVSHQASIHDLARECSFDATTMRVKVGVQGRLVLGEDGKPGTYTIPLRIAVRSNGQVIQSKLVARQVTIPANDSQAGFVIVDDGLALPITAEDPGEAYTILVGLDPQGSRQRPQRGQRRR